MNSVAALLTLAMITAIKCPAIGLGVLNVVLLNLSPAWKARATRDLLPRKRGFLTIFGRNFAGCMDNGDLGWTADRVLVRTVRTYGLCADGENEKKAGSDDEEHQRAVFAALIPDGVRGLLKRTSKLIACRGQLTDGASRKHAGGAVANAVIEHGSGADEHEGAARHHHALEQTIDAESGHSVGASNGKSCTRADLVFMRVYAPTHTVSALFRDALCAISKKSVRADGAGGCRPSPA